MISLVVVNLTKNIKTDLIINVIAKQCCSSEQKRRTPTKINRRQSLSESETQVSPSIKTILHFYLKDFYYEIIFALFFNWNFSLFHQPDINLYRPNLNFYGLIVFIDSIYFNFISFHWGNIFLGSGREATTPCPIRHTTTRTW